MKIRDIFETGDHVSPMDDMKFADNAEERDVPSDQAPTDDKGWKRTIRTGANSKKAARIASMARTTAKDADPTPDETIEQPGQSTSMSRM